MTSLEQAADVDEDILVETAVLTGLCDDLAPLVSACEDPAGVDDAAAVELLAVVAPLPGL